MNRRHHHLYPLPRDSFNVREVEDEYAIVVDEEHLRARYCLNADQKAAYDEIIRYVNNNDSGVFFIDGPGGTGKTYLYNALLAEVRSRGSVALATASSGAAANNLPGGRTSNPRFKILLNVDKKSFCSINKQSGMAKLIREAKLIIWDEASMAKRHAIEAVDRTMQDIMGDSRAFGGKVMVMGGDFRQVLPVVRRGTRAQVVDASLRMSPLWSTIKKMQLSINMRARTDPWFLDFLLRVGDGVEESVEDTYIKIPNKMVIPYIGDCTANESTSTDALIDAVFPAFERNSQNFNYITSRAILSTKNEASINTFRYSTFNRAFVNRGVTFSNICLVYFI
ncbi:ATP-dependent DNA helicase PIF1-like protein [Tanacetum coccineum]